jgi:heme/copper-type cytochrome/quinol oxidase subunit 2
VIGTKMSKPYTTVYNVQNVLHNSSNVMMMMMMMTMMILAVAVVVVVVVVIHVMYHKKSGTLWKVNVGF